MPKINPDAPVITEEGAPVVTEEQVPVMTAKAIAAANDKKAEATTAATAAEAKADVEAALEAIKSEDAKHLMSTIYMANPYTGQVWFPNEQHEESKVDVDNWTKAQLLAGTIIWT